MITNAAPWSSDLLGDPNNGAGAIMFGGETGSWQIDPGCYDVRVTPSEIGLDFYANGVQLRAGQSVTVTINEFPLDVWYPIRALAVRRTAGPGPRS